MALLEEVDNVVEIHGGGILMLKEQWKKKVDYEKHYETRAEEYCAAKHSAKSISALLKRMHKYRSSAIYT